MDKIVWKGDVFSPYGDSVEAVTRPLLLNYSQQRPDLFDFVHSTCSNCPGHSMPEQVARYASVLDIGGAGLSGRLKYLLFSRRPLYLVDRHCVEYFHSDLVPYQHYIPVLENLTDLEAQAEWGRSHRAEARTIAENAFQFATTHFRKDRLVQRMRSVMLSQCEPIKPRRRDSPTASDTP